MPGAEIELPRMDALLEVGTSFNRLVALYQANSDYQEEERILQNLSLANCYSAHHFLLGFRVLLRFCDAQSSRSFHPLHCYPGPLARTWQRPFPGCGVASPQAPTPDRESLPATIAQSTRVGPHPRRLARALGATNSSAPVGNRTEALDTARPSQSLEQAKVSHAVLPGSPSVLCAGEKNRMRDCFRAGSR
jgi:hypothetical protein